jgi:nickel-dependent lactate racemase
MVTITLPYNQTSVTMDLPDDKEVLALKPRKMAPLENPRDELRMCLKGPPGWEPLEKMAEAVDGEVLIITQDHTRVNGKDRVLPWLLDLLNEYGVPDDRIGILIGLGSHKRPTEEVARATVGPAYDRVTVTHHDPSGPMVDCGTTSAGTKVNVNAALKEAGLVILYSSVVHHYFAGYGGGRKLIVPGIASLDTIASNHSLTWDPKGHGRHHMVKSGILDGNPVSDDMLECARLALDGVNYISINSVITPKKEFGYFAAGEIYNTHKSACDLADAHFMVSCDDKADIVIASAGGFPKDINLIQSHKGMDNVSHVLKPGGTLIYLMGCSEGYGNAAILDFAPLDMLSIRAKLEESYVVYGQTVHAIKEKTSKFRVIVVTELDNDLARTLGFIPVSTIEEASALVKEDIENAELIYHVPRGDITVAQCME